MARGAGIPVIPWRAVAGIREVRRVGRIAELARIGRVGITGIEANAANEAGPRQKRITAAGTGGGIAGAGSMTRVRRRTGDRVSAHAYTGAVAGIRLRAGIC